MPFTSRCREKIQPEIRTLGIKKAPQSNMNSRLDMVRISAHPNHVSCRKAAACHTPLHSEQWHPGALTRPNMSKTFTWLPSVSRRVLFAGRNIAPVGC